jgi:hypothetical protein
MSVPANVFVCVTGVCLPMSSNMSSNVCVCVSLMYVAVPVCFRQATRAFSVRMLVCAYLHMCT